MVVGVVETMSIKEVVVGVGVVKSWWCLEWSLGF